MPEPNSSTIDQVTPTQLDEIYKIARMRLQMCQRSILVKYNDDKNQIFSTLKKELDDIYARLRHAINQES